MEELLGDRPQKQLEPRDISDQHPLMRTCSLMSPWDYPKVSKGLLLVS